LTRAKRFSSLGVFLFLAASLALVTGGFGLANADEDVTIDFEGLTPGQIVVSVTTDPNGGISGNPVPGSIAVNGQGGTLPAAPNTAIIFDSTCAGGPDPSGCTGGDPDLYQPAQGNVLIVAENLTDAGSDGIVDDPDDDALGGTLSFDFSGFGFGLGEVTVVSVTILDAGDGGETPPGDFIFHTTGGDLTIPIDAVADGGINVQTFLSGAGVTGVVSFDVAFSGSGATDDVRVLVQEPTPETTPQTTPETTPTEPPPTPTDPPGETPTQPPVVETPTPPPATATPTPPAPTATPPAPPVQEVAGIFTPPETGDAGLLGQ
jgi:hypothetical protein